MMDDEFKDDQSEEELEDGFSLGDDYEDDEGEDEEDLFANGFSEDGPKDSDGESEF